MPNPNVTSPVFCATLYIHQQCIMFWFHARLHTVLRIAYSQWTQHAHGDLWHRGSMQSHIEQNQLRKKLHLTAPICRYRIYNKIIMISCNLKLLISDIRPRHTSTALAAHRLGSTGIAEGSRCDHLEPTGGDLQLSSTLRWYHQLLPPTVYQSR